MSTIFYETNPAPAVDGTNIVLNNAGAINLSDSILAKLPTSAPSTAGYVPVVQSSGKVNWGSVKPTVDGKTIDYNSSGQLTDISTKIFENKTLTASSWVKESPATYSSYPYRYDITCTGIDSTYFPEVIFSVNDAESGSFAPVSQSTTNVIKIWSNSTKATTIPTISCTKQGG